MKYCPDCASPIVWRLAAGRERPACPACGFIHYEDPKLVAVAIVPIKGKLVLGRRAIEPRLGFWSFPAGYVNRGEPVETAAVREVAEETGLLVEVEHLVGLYSRPDDPIVLAAYLTRPCGGQLAPGDETSEVGLFAVGALPELAFPDDQHIVDDWLQYEAFRVPSPSPMR